MEQMESASVSARPAAKPKAEGRCTEGNFCADLYTHSCVYDTESTVSTATERSSVQCYGISREGEERPGTPPPHQNFTLDDLKMFVGDRDGMEGQNDAPSIIWTNGSVLSTLASVLETDPSVVSTLPSVVSTNPSVLVVDEVDLRYKCQCGVQMGLQERVATREWSARYPAPYVCYDCRWKSAGV